MKISIIGVPAYVSLTIYFLLTALSIVLSNYVKKTSVLAFSYSLT